MHRWVGILALLVLACSVTPVSAGWSKEVLLESDYYLQVVGVSDDGNRIVYIADTDNNDATTWDWEVFMMDLETGEVTRITRNVDQEVQAGISGDGNVIVYGTKVVENGETVYKYYTYTVSSGSVRFLRDFHKDVLDEHYTPSHSSILVNTNGRLISIPYNRYSDYYNLYCTYDFRIYRDSGLSFWRDDAAGLPIPEIKGNHKVEEDLTSDNQQTLYLRVIDELNLETIFTTNPGEKLYIVYCGAWVGCRLGTPLPFSVSFDGKRVVFVVYPDPYAETAENIRKGIFLYENGAITQISQKTPPFIRISGDGSKIFYVERLGRYSYKLFTMNSDGSGEMAIDHNGVGLSFITESMFTNYDGSIVVLSGEDGDFEGYKILLYRDTGTDTGTVLSDITGKIPAINQQFHSNSVVFMPLDQTVIEFGSVEALPGSEVQIPVKVRYADKIGAISLLLNYPSDVLDVEDVIAGSLTQNSMLEYNVEGDNISIGIVDSEGISGNGSLLYIRFRVLSEEELANKGGKGNEKEDTSKLSLKPEQIAPVKNEFDLIILEATVTNVDEEEVEVVTIDGNLRLITEEEANKGDVNGDGEITSVDALLALQMSVGKLEPNMIADMNDDGKVKPDDALKILKIANEQMVGQLVKQKFRVGIGTSVGVNVGVSQAGKIGQSG
ncbi:MAG: hypothetical protein H0Z28_09180 [Archaeoglobus sp.]|nr:hypothetical protein [Archaeoglobus sp.]